MASFLTTLTDSLCLHVVQMPKSLDLANVCTDDRQTKRIALSLAAHSRAGLFLIKWKSRQIGEKYSKGAYSQTNLQM
jgi:hypothetical protein